MKKISVLIVEDHELLLLEMVEFLQSRNYEVCAVHTLQEAEGHLQHPVDIVILDINLPDGNGLDFCRKIRPYVKSGIIMFTGRSEAAIKIESLRGGADAYLVKPVNPDELEATLISVYRRLDPQERHLLVPAPLPLVFRIDTKIRVLHLPNKASVDLTPGETFFLSCLFQAPDHTVTREQLSAAYEAIGEPYTDTKIENIVSRLKRKVQSAAQQALPISSVYGKGYAFKGDARIL
jgi:DNA-binding response OmpR family regulator